MEKDKHNEGSYMYYRDYTNEKDELGETLKRNHETAGALAGKALSKLRGRAGRFRGKSGRQENNKARGGKMAR